MRDIVERLKAIDLKSIDLQGIDKKRAGTAVATLAIALGTGYYMQSGQPANVAPLDAPVAQVQAASVLPGVTTEQAQPAAADASLTVAVTDAPSVTAPVDAEKLANEQSDLRASDPISAQPDPAEATKLAALGDVAPDIAPVLADAEPAHNCSLSLAATPAKMAMITLDVAAPCSANAEVEFSHAGLRFTERLNENGNGSYVLPALMKDAKIVARLADGAFTEIDLTIPDAGLYRRAALVWEGATGLQLHAFEEGADYGGEGHIWAEAPGNADRITQGQGGFVTMLGSVSQGYAADIYTYPATMMRSMSGPEISIEAQVLETTCNVPVAGTFLRANGSTAPVESSVSISAPGCDAIGEFLVLQGLPQDLKIALN
ncbi:hypothetical protein [Aliiroseovarius lamellibrachiae]|uniref:hypothetical protein n=1 Tax=Aliiroseovarius lamellibrachiae TaxID=1924933 RepID=UPI001BDF78F8|nr:hypothetical protein [Aliiroseovarius lamellibrachiae]MBT2131765.1 hypothetical protein [Aliiroseovarius lamellibrachiae]